jgi:hypothetical protein
VTHFTFESHSTSEVIGLWCFFQPWHWENPGFPIFSHLKSREFYTEQAFKKHEAFQMEPTRNSEYSSVLPRAQKVRWGHNFELRQKGDSLSIGRQSHSIAPQKWMVVDA